MLHKLGVNFPYEWLYRCAWSLVLRTIRDNHKYEYYVMLANTQYKLNEIVK